MVERESEALFGLGDTVQLASGGPEMTINKISINHSTNKFSGMYDTQWFAGKKLESGRFPEESLKLVTKKG